MSMSKELKYMLFAVPDHYTMLKIWMEGQSECEYDMQSNSEVMVDELEKNLLGIKFVFL